MPCARAGDTFAVLDQEQGAMGGALDQAVTGVEELVRGPFESDATVRAAIDIDVDLATPAYGEQFLAVEVETTAAGVGQFNAGTQKFHADPQVASTDQIAELPNANPFQMLRILAAASRDFPAGKKRPGKSRVK
jgi:hypothetical protein